MSKSDLNIDINSSGESGKQIFLDKNSANKNIQQTDRELWNAFKRGSLTAYKLIYQQNIDLLFKYGNTIMPHSGLVTDCIQDMFVDLWDKRSKLGKVNNIKGYLFISYRRRLLDLLKRQKNNLNIEDIDCFKILMSEPIIDMNLKDEKIDSIMLALNALTCQKKEAIYLRFFNDLSCSEISEIMRIKTQSVYNLISSGLKIIKDGVIIFLLLAIHNQLI